MSKFLYNFKKNKSNLFEKFTNRKYCTMIIRIGQYEKFKFCKKRDSV